MWADHTWRPTQQQWLWQIMTSAALFVCRRASCTASGLRARNDESLQTPAAETNDTRADDTHQVFNLWALRPPPMHVLLPGTQLRVLVACPTVIIREQPRISPVCSSYCLARNAASGCMAAPLSSPVNRCLEGQPMRLSQGLSDTERRGPTAQPH